MKQAEALVELFDRGNSHMHISAFTDFVNAEEDVSGAYLPKIPPTLLASL